MLFAEFIAIEFYGNTVLAYMKAVGIVLASIVLGKAAYYLINRYIKKLLAKTETKLDDLLMDAVEEPMIVFIIVWSLHLALQSLLMPVSFQVYVGGLVTVLLILDVMWLVLRVIDIVIQEVVLPLTSKTDTTLDDQLMPILSRGLKILTVILGVLIILSNLGIEITPLIAGLGVGGLAVALASKDTVENMFGAFAILLDKPFSIKDRVVIDKVTGDVMEVGLRSTRIVTLDHTELYVPNSKVVTGIIENLSRPNRCLVVEEKLAVTYDTPVQKIREGISIVKKILAETEGVSKDYATCVTFEDFADSSLIILMKFWVEEYLQIHEVKSQVNQKIKEEFEKARIEFAYPTQKIYIAK